MIEVDIQPGAASTTRTPAQSMRPAAVSSEWEWQLEGACRDRDGELFFHPYGEREPSRSRRDRAAQAICAECPVLLRCRSYALATREAYGVWGGLTETDRAEILTDAGQPPRERMPVGAA